MSKVTSAPAVVAEDAIYLPLLTGHDAYQSIVILQLSQQHMMGKNVYSTLA